MFFCHFFGGFSHRGEDLGYIPSLSPVVGWGVTHLSHISTINGHAGSLNVFLAGIGLEIVDVLA